MDTLWSYLRLYRLDAALISFLSYTSGCVLAGMRAPQHFVPGILVSLISFNFIYTLNAWSDREIDAKNKPGRPIPSGEVSPRAALRYATALGVLSFAYPILLTRDVLSLALFWILPVLGYLYSVEPLRIRRRRFLAGITIALMYLIPMAAGLLSNRERIDAVHAATLGYFFILCLSVIPLKDIGDRTGDLADGSDNWEENIGVGGLYLYSICGLCVASLFAYFLPIAAPLRISLLGLSLLIIAVVGIFRLFRLNPNLLYRNILFGIALGGLIIIPMWIISSPEESGALLLQPKATP